MLDIQRSIPHLFHNTKLQHHRQRLRRAEFVKSFCERTEYLIVRIPVRWDCGDAWADNKFLETLGGDRLQEVPELRGADHKFSNNV